MFELHFFDPEDYLNNSLIFYRKSREETQSCDYARLSEKLKVFFDDIRKEYPPSNGEFSSDWGIADYVFYPSRVHISVPDKFGERLEARAKYYFAQDYGLAYYNPRTGEMVSSLMTVAELESDSGEVVPADDQKIFDAVDRLGDDDFLILSLKKAGKCESAIQCRYKAEKQSFSFFGFFSSEKIRSAFYHCEILRDDKIYFKDFEDREAVKEILLSYCENSGFSTFGWPSREI